MRNAGIWWRRLSPRSGAALVLAALLVTWSAFGQPSGKGAAGSKKGKGDSEQAADAGAVTDAAPVSEASVEDDEPPPPARKSGAAKQSPLTPGADEFPDAATHTPKDFDKLLGDIATLRGRVSALTTTLFASKIKVLVETDGDDARISAFSVTVDDGVVYRAKGQFIAEDEKVVYEHGVAPGYHIIGVELERHDARNKAFKTWQSSKFSVSVPEGKKLEAVILLEDDSDMAEDFPEDQEGEYDLRVRLEAQVDE